MPEPKLHHWVPQFYLRRFTDASGRLWLWDRDRDRAFPTRPKQVAAEKDFYKADELAELGGDPYEMEKQFAALEADAAELTDTLLAAVRNAAPGERSAIIDGEEREILALFLALQFLRTKDRRELIAAPYEVGDNSEPLSRGEARRNHVTLLWTDDFYQGLADHIRRGTWVFGHNATAVPFFTSDNPVAFRTGDNKKWLKAALYRAKTYMVYPLSPDVLMYSFPDHPFYDRLKQFDGARSPAPFSGGEVRFENNGQAFMASRSLSRRTTTSTTSASSPRRTYPCPAQCRSSDVAGS